MGYCWRAAHTFNTPIRPPLSVSLLGIIFAGDKGLTLCQGANGGAPWMAKGWLTSYGPYCHRRPLMVIIVFSLLCVPWLQVPSCTFVLPKIRGCGRVQNDQRPVGIRSSGSQRQGKIGGKWPPSHLLSRTTVQVPFGVGGNRGRLVSLGPEWSWNVGICRWCRAGRGVFRSQKKLRMCIKGFQGDL